MNFLKPCVRRVIGALLLVSAGLAQAAWPDKPITLIVPYPPGGNADVMGRMLATRLTSKLGQTVIVENRPGAGSMLGSYQVVRAAPDGYTFLLGSIANAVNLYFIKKPLYDMVNGLTPVSQLVSVPNFVAVGPKEKFRSLASIIGYAKANPNKLSCATTGLGASTYLSCELFKQQAGIQLVNVPYKGGVAAMQDVAGGQAAMVFANEALPWIADKRLVGIAVTSGKRTPLAPELPAIAETLPGFDVSSWYGVFAPVGVPREILNRVAAESISLMKDPSIAGQLKILGATPVGSTPAQFQQFFRDEQERWGKATKGMNIQLN